MKLTDIINKTYENIKEEKSTQKKKEYKTDLLHADMKRFLDRTSPKEWNKEPYDEANKYMNSHFIQAISSEDISQFALELTEYENHPLFNQTGYFLSAIINKHSEKNPAAHYTLLLNYLQKKLEGICFKNEADVTIVGDCDESFCYSMKKGTVLLEGSCGNGSCTYLSGGSVHIKGNTYGNFAQTIGGGHIHIEGTCKKSTFREIDDEDDDSFSYPSLIGSHMHKGIIEIDGNCELSVGTAMSSGKIIVKGNLTEEEYKSVKSVVIEGVGRSMHGGEIHVYGDAGENIGADMCGGKLYLYGTYKDISKDFIAGKIYHKDVLIQSRWKKNIKRMKSFFGMKK